MSLSRAALPELVIAAGTVAATAVAGYAMAGGAGAAVVLVAAAVLALVLLRTLVPAEGATDDGAGDRRPRGRPDRGVAPTMTGYWRQRFSVGGGMSQLSSYETGLRRTLEHLLAARLAERHGINLYEEPAAARRVFCGGGPGGPGGSGGRGGPSGRDGDLWAWISPDRVPAPAAGRRGGIPPRTLGRILDRLEQL